MKTHGNVDLGNVRTQVKVVRVLPLDIGVSCFFYPFRLESRASFTGTTGVLSQVSGMNGGRLAVMQNAKLGNN